MTDRQINRWLRRQFAPVGWVLLANYWLLNLMVLAVAGVDYLMQLLQNFAAGVFPFDVDVDAIYNNAWGYAASIAVALVLLYAWKGSDYWKTEIFAKEKKIRLPVFLTVTLLCMGAQMLSSIWMTVVELVMNSFGSSVMPILDSVSGSTSSFSMFLYSALLAPVYEELLFRGFVLRTLRPYGKRFAIWGSALAFGFFHGNILQAPYAIAVGLLLGWLTCEYSINWAIALHIFNNLILAEGITRLLEYLPYAVGDLVFGGIFLGAFLLSCVLLVKKRSEIKAYRSSEWIDRRCVKCFITNWGVILFLATMVISMISMMAI